MTIVRYDTSPIGTGKNWVSKTDPVQGLGSFVRAIVHALMRSGHPKGEAIAIAEGVIKKWAAGKGTWGKSHHVTPQTQAKAAAAVAHWEALKAAAHAERYDDFDMETRKAWGRDLHPGHRVHYYTAAGHLQHALVKKVRPGAAYGGGTLVNVDHISMAGTTDEYVSNTGAVVEAEKLEPSADSNFWHEHAKDTPGYTTHVRSMETRAGKAGPAGSADAKAQNKGAAKRKAAGNQAGGTALKGDHAKGHKFYGNQHTKVGSDPNAKPQTVGMKVPTGGGNASPGSALSALGNKANDKAASQAVAAAAAQQAQQSVSDVQGATKEYQAAKASVVKSQQHLTMAIAQSKQDVNFAKGREGAIAGVAKDGKQAQSVTLAAAARIQQAKNDLADSQLRLSAAQDSLTNSLKSAKPKHVSAVAAYANAVTQSKRDDDEEIEVRKLWGRDLPGRRAMGLHKTAMKHGAKALESPSRAGFTEAIRQHVAASEAFHELAGTHRVNLETAASIGARRVGIAHAKVAANMRDAVTDKTLTEKEDKAISQARAAAAEAYGDYFATAGPQDKKFILNRDTPEPLLRDFVGEGNPPSVGDTSGASQFLPVGPSKKQSAAITHRFKGSNLASCEECGKPVGKHGKRPKAPGQPIAPSPREATHLRHRGTDGHERTSTGHVKGVPARHQQAAKARNLRNFDSIEEPLTAALKKHFGEQRKSTLNRLMGKRGGQMLKRAAAPPREPTSSEPGATPAAGPISTASVFDPVFWADKTTDVITPHLQHAGTLAAAEVAKQLNISEADDMVAQKVWPGGSDAPLKAIIAQRSADAAQHITGTTSDQLNEALQAGVTAGEGRDAIAKRVNDVFDHADITRAKLIAQTETVGAYNQAQTDYASSLPLKVIGNKVWLAHDDDRTRPTHRIANGQEVPMGGMYAVGSAQMAYPGDKTAPIGEWINCRCSQAFLPKGMTYAPVAAAAQAYVDAIHANKPPPPKSPYKTGEAA